MLWYIPLAVGALIALWGLWKAVYTLVQWKKIEATVQALISVSEAEARVFRDGSLEPDQEMMRPVYVADAESAARDYREKELPQVRFVRGFRWLISGVLVMFAAWLVHVYG